MRVGVYTCKKGEVADRIGVYSTEMIIQNNQSSF